MLIGAVAVASTLTLVGCGSATQISATGASLTKATFAAAMTKATSKATSVHMLMHATTQGQQISMTADVSLDQAPAGQHVTMEQTLAKTSMAMQMSMPGGIAIDMRLIQGVMYFKGTGLGIPQAAGKPWMKIDLSDADNPLASMFGNMSSFEPAQMARVFKSISTLTKVGSETVDGVPTTHYKVSIDTAKASDLLNLPAGADTSALPDTLTYDVWVDGSARMVKMAMSMKQVTMDMHFSHWNEPVHVVTPPASQVSAFGH